MLRTGTLGEEIAAKYLRGSEYKIVEINWRRVWAEIDIVAIDPKGVLVFVEVKTSRLRLDKIDNFQPEVHFDSKKKEKVKRAATYYANLRRGLIQETAGWRVDLIAVVINEKDCSIRHYRNVAG